MQRLRDAYPGPGNDCSHEEEITFFTGRTFFSWLDFKACDFIFAVFLLLAANISEDSQD